MLRKILLTFALYGALMASWAQPVATYVPPRAVTLMPIIKEEIKLHAKTLQSPWVIPAIFDKESCPGYKSSICFNTHAELRVKCKNSDILCEQGLGFGQMTRTWNTNGTIRFDNIANLKRLYPNELGDLDWDTYKNMPHHQVRSSVILFRDEYNAFRAVPVEIERSRMSRSAYNGGRGRVNTARSACKLTSGCDPLIWYSNVENHLPQSRVKDKRYGNRSMYEINTSYVRDTDLRLNKYKPYFNEEPWVSK